MLLESLFDGLDVVTAPFAVCELRGHMQLAMPKSDNATIHYVLAGQGCLTVGEDTRADLAPGAMVVLPPGLAHRIEVPDGAVAHSPLPRCGALGEGWQRVREGAPDQVGGLFLACSEILANYQGRPLFRYLDGPLVERCGEDDRLSRALDQLLDELAVPQPGTRILAAALMQQCLVHLLRRHCGSGECRVPWLLALDDHRLAPALEAMLGEPGAPHSIEQLAAAAGMSRTSFATHFSSAFDCGPMEFLKEIRLTRAARLLRRGDRPVKAIAAAVGYESRSAFSRAFHERYGLAPVDFRSQQAPLVQA